MIWNVYFLMLPSPMPESTGYRYLRSRAFLPSLSIFFSYTHFLPIHPPPLLRISASTRRGSSKSIKLEGLPILQSGTSMFKAKSAFWFLILTKFLRKSSMYFCADTSFCLYSVLLTITSLQRIYGMKRRKWEGSQMLTFMERFHVEKNGWIVGWMNKWRTGCVDE